VKLNVSLPANLRQEADAAAKALGVSRSRLIRTALEEFLKLRRDKAAESIDRIAEHGTERSEEEEAWIKAGQATVWEALKDDDWGRAAVSKKRASSKKSNPKKRS
jgi:hypothetical protein